MYLYETEQNTWMWFTESVKKGGPECLCWLSVQLLIWVQVSISGLGVQALHTLLKKQKQKPVKKNT